MERWLSGECLGGVSGDMVDCGVGNSEGGGVGFGLGFRRFPAECGLVFDAERRGRVAGGLGEVGGRIPGGSGGVSASGSVWKEERKVGYSGSVPEGKSGLSLAGNRSGISSSLSGINSLIFLLSFPSVFNLISLLPPLDLTTPFLAFAGLPH